LRLLALGALGRGGDQERALAELAAEVGLAAVELAMHLVAPRGERVDPGLDRVLPVAAGVDREAALPGVAVDVRVDPAQRRLLPAGGRGRISPVLHDRAQLLVAVGEDLRA